VRALPLVLSMWKERDILWDCSNAELSALSRQQSVISIQLEAWGWVSIGDLKSSI
jgi:hypothetical protein